MEQFGRYMLTERIAAGGMAEIWRGALVGMSGFSRPLAIKRIRAESAGDPEFIRMLIDEARIASALHHPHVVQVMDLGEFQGNFFMAMEFVHGRHLGQVIGKSVSDGPRLPFPFGVAVVRDALLGLAHAHGKTNSKGENLQIVHRDISPQNIMVGFDGSVRVADFGIARAMGRLTNTDAGVLKGKFAYVSPEQAKGDVADARADLWAMAVVLWETLAGERLHPARLTHPEVLARVIKGEIRPLQSVASSVPKVLQEIVAKGLAPRLEDRFQSAHVFASELSRALGQLAPGYATPDVAHVMRDLFGGVIEEEGARLAELESLARKLSVASMPVVNMPTPAAFKAPEELQDTARMTPPPKPALPARVAAKPTVAWPLVAGGALLLAGCAALAVVVVKGRQAQVVKPAGAARAVLVVDSIPAGATVSVDGKVAGVAPVQVDVELGALVQVRAVLRKRGVVSRSVSVTDAKQMLLLELPASP